MPSAVPMPASPSIWKTRPSAAPTAARCILISTRSANIVCWKVWTILASPRKKPTRSKRLKTNRRPASPGSLVKETATVSRPKNILMLPGDGIGPEVMGEVARIITWMNDKLGSGFVVEQDLVGGSCYDVHGCAVTDATMAKAHAADAVLLGAVGGPKWDNVARQHRP